MSAAGITFSRTVGRMRSQFSTAFAVCGFFCVSAAVFAFALARAEGGSASLASVWAAAVSPVLPVLAVFLSMDVWCDERQSGRMDMLLSSPVRERDFAIGKFLGCWAVLAATLAACLGLSTVFLKAFAPSALSRTTLGEFLLAYAILALQGALWCSAASAFSAVFRTAAASAVAALLATAAVPRGLWAAWTAWTGPGRTAFAEMPLEAHVADFTSGLASTGVIALYLLPTLFFVFAATKAAACHRMIGRKASGPKAAALFSVVLAGAFTVLAVLLAMRLDTVADIPVGGSRVSFSPRTRSILAEAGNFSVTCFLGRSDPRFRPVARFLRQLRREAESTGGASLTIEYIDPVWDVGAAERLARTGAEEGSLVFSRGRKQVMMPLGDGLSERACASTIRKLLTPLTRSNVYWTTGHGEASFDAYSSFGMSDIGRDLAREGYINAFLDLASSQRVPSDCALVIIAGAQHDFSRTEIGWLESYLREGGRLMILMGAKLEGLSSLLTSWGIRPDDAPPGVARTLSGTDAIADEFADHEISAPLRGSRVVLERPTAFKPSAAASGVGADSISFTAIAGAGGTAFAAAAERGAGAGGDLAIRPTRIVAVGDAGFVMNGPLAARANANRDFFLNSIAFLSGTHSSGSSGTETVVLVSGMDRSARLRHLVWSACVAPGVLLLILSAMHLRRRLAV